MTSILPIYCASLKLTILMFLMHISQEVLDLAFSITYDVEEYSLSFIASSRTDVS